jgi:hypothetical protein
MHRALWDGYLICPRTPMNEVLSLFIQAKPSTCAALPCPVYQSG